MDEEHRTGLRFVRSAVLRSGADGTGTEEEVERTDHEPATKNQTALERDLEILAKREQHGSLYDQLKNKRDEQNEEWERQRAAQDRPQELDEEDEHFLLEHIEKERLKEIERRREEESHLAAFAEARKNRIHSSSTSILNIEKTSDDTEPADQNHKAAISDTSNLNNNVSTAKYGGGDSEDDEGGYATTLVSGLIKGKKKKSKKKKKKKEQKKEKNSKKRRQNDASSDSEESANDDDMPSSHAKRSKLVPY